MGYQERDYYREEDEQPKGFQLSSQRTMVLNLVLLCVAVFAIDSFTSVKSGELVTTNAETKKQEPKFIGSADERVANWDANREEKYVVTRWLSDLLALKGDVFDSPRLFLANCWQFLTYGFVHAPLGGRRAFSHIGLNMLALWIFGREVESKYGPWEFLRFYLVGALAAGLLWAAIHRLFQQGGAMYGASGAVTAVVILFVLNYPTRTLHLFGVVAIPAWVFGVLFVGLDVVGSLTQAEGVAYEAHLGGAAFALAYHWSGINFGSLWPRRWTVSTAWIKPQPELRVHDPDPDLEDTYRDLDERADQILDKLHREGEHSLSRQERRILEAYSRRMRQKHS